MALADLGVDGADQLLIDLIKRKESRGTNGTLLYALREMNAYVPLPTLIDIISEDRTYEALEGADACLVLTEWEDFAALDLGRVKQLLRYPIVVDGRNLFQPALMEAAGLNYYSVGRPDVVGERPGAIKAALKEAARQNEAA